MPEISAISFAPARYVEDRFACLVFASMNSNSKPVEALNVLDGCNSWVQKKMIIHKARFEDYVHLVVYHPWVPPLVTPKLNFRLIRCETPTYLLVFHVYGSNGINRESIQALDICYGDQICRMIPLTHYSTTPWPMAE